MRIKSAKMLPNGSLFPKYILTVTILLWVVTGLLCGGCNNKPEQKKFIIGFSQSGEADEWRKSMWEDMKRELSFHPEMEILYRETNDNSEKQISQVKDLLTHHIDVLIISASEAAPLTPIVEKVYDSGIPVIVIDRKIASEKFTNHVGADNIQIGEMAGDYLARILKGKGRILEITGKPASSPAIERSLGFATSIKHYPQLKIAKTINGEWLEANANHILMQRPGILDSVDAVFAHNDVMGLGAYQALLKLKKKKLPIVGVDALPAPAIGLKSIQTGKLVASMLYPTGGKEAIRNAVLLEKHKMLPKQTTLQTMVVDSSNVLTMLMQTSKIAAQQQDIERQGEMLTAQKKIYHSQQSFIYLLVSLLLLFLIVSLLLFYSRKLNRRINQELILKNKDISRQSEQLVVMSKKAEEASEAKLNFFTKISHEFRTPLTLILSPTEDLLANGKLPAEVKTGLNFIKKNAFRLLRLVNQLMDLRQVEFGKIRLHVSEQDVVAFCNEIILSFSAIAQKRNIDCRFITQHRSYLVWFDADILEKVLFNLLSNAFKFTLDGGSILLELTVDSAQQKLKFSVKDTGIGMTKQEQEKIFDLFFRANNEVVNSSGVGLNLTKELVEIHHGSILLNSQKNVGSDFLLTFPLNKNAYTNEERANHIILRDELKNLENIYTTELMPDAKNEANMLVDINKNVTDKATLLIIEDNKDLQKLLQSQLQSDFEVVVEGNGRAGFNKAFDIIPDLILCDIMLPGMDGLLICSQLKKDIRTTHIPIILLTGKASEIQHLDGLKSYANAYIPKPFSMTVLKQTIETLMYNYKRVKEHYTSIGNYSYAPLELDNPPQNVGTPLTNKAPKKKSDRRFTSEFISIVEHSLHDEAFSVETICQQMNISKVQLYRKVKGLLNVNVNEYIVNARIQKAKYYLENEDLPIGDIAFKTGFTSAAYFSTVFKSKIGSTPKEYKRLSQGRV